MSASDEMREAIDAGAATDIDWRGRALDALGPELLADLEEWTLLAAMSLPADEDVLERVKAAVGNDRGSECCLWMMIDLAQQQRRRAEAAP